MQQILRSLNINASAAEAQQVMMSWYRTPLITPDGVKVEGSEGTTPMTPHFPSIQVMRRLPDCQYEAIVEGSQKYIIPMQGTGLWGPIWGYLAVEADGSTIYGSEFGHQGETPGLGAEIVMLSFREQFIGKELIKEGHFRSVAVVKPGQATSDRDYVDGISGGTITSKGVDAMLLNSVGQYSKFLLNLNAAQ